MKKTYVIPDNLKDLRLMDISVVAGRGFYMAVDDMDGDNLAGLVSMIAGGPRMERIEPGSPDFEVSAAELGFDDPAVQPRGIYVLTLATDEKYKLVLNMDNPYLD